MDQENANLQGRNNGDSNLHKVDGQNYSFSFAFKQQLMRAWQPVPTLGCAIIMFTLFGGIFLFIGIGLYVQSLSLFDKSWRYDDKCELGVICNQSIDIEKDLTENVFFYYEIRNFYQNHRRYFKSKSNEQLRGNDLDLAKVNSDCDPVVKNKDLWRTISIGNNNLDPEGVAFPCGMMARSIFNDTFQIYKADDTTGVRIEPEISATSLGIAWPEDKKFKFKNLAQPSMNQKQWIDIEDERFMVWMRAAATPNFRKLWARFSVLPLKKGKYVITINNRWDVAKFNGQKYFVISQTNSFGGKNTFLSVCYLVVGTICILAAFLFLIRRILRPNGILEARLK